MTPASLFGCLCRYSMTDSTPGFDMRSGSFMVFLSATPPEAGTVQRSNWLPICRGPFYLVLRLYGPSKIAQVTAPPLYIYIVIIIKCYSCQKRQGASCRQAANKGCQTPTPCWTRQIQARPNQPWARCSVYVPSPASRGPYIHI